jgi:hypothetical protein
MRLKAPVGPCMVGEPYLHHSLFAGHAHQDDCASQCWPREKVRDLYESTGFEGFEVSGLEGFLNILDLNLGFKHDCCSAGTLHYCPTAERTGSNDVLLLALVYPVP